MTTAAPSDNCTVGIDYERFPAYDPGLRWNGWVCPTFTRAAAERISTYINHINRRGAYPEDQDYLHWLPSGELLLISAQWLGDSDGAVQSCGPDAFGRYSIGSHHWTWSRTDSDDVPNPTQLSAPFSGNPVAARHAWILTAKAHGISVEDTSDSGDVAEIDTAGAVQVHGQWHTLRTTRHPQPQVYAVATPIQQEYHAFFDVEDPFLHHCREFIDECQRGCRCMPTSPDEEYLLSPPTRKTQIDTLLAQQNRAVQLYPPCNTLIIAATNREQEAFWARHPACQWA